MTAVEFRDPRLPERFWNNVTTDPETGCWNWTAAKDRLGYGRIGRPKHGGTRLSHRHAFLVLVGPIESRLVLDHLCRNPSCCNPAHLEPVTQGENLRRSPTIGTKKNAPPCCPSGHEFTEDNTLYKQATDRHGNPRRHRICKTCNRRACSEYGKRRRANKK